MAKWSTIEGTPTPLGVSWIEDEQAYNFAIYSKHAHGIVLLLFGDGDLVKPLHEVRFDPLPNKTSRIWHCRLKKNQIGRAKYYAYRIHGPTNENGTFHAFDPEKILIDPYATGVYFPPAFDREAARHPGRNDGKAPLGILPVAGNDPFDWDGDRSPRHESDLIIYEMHVRGFTMSPTSGLASSRHGTYAGIIEKIPYLKELGITAVELMPVQQFDPQERNYWGYMTLNFFSPHDGYALHPKRPVDDFREMVKALHKANIEVILDVVYNHTGEENELGPTYSFKGIDNCVYYHYSADPKSPYLNSTGTGNTLLCSNRNVRTMIVDSLRHWVTEMHVDGFRFDLASVFTYNADGTVNWIDPPLLTAIQADPVLRQVRLIAEPWDVQGIYQLGSNFPGRLWHQWNDRFRDDIRRFVRGDRSMVGPLMRRLYGSDDHFPDSLMDSCRPFHSINYFVSHDGFTLYDLVSYNRKHNLANGHDEKDGPNDNLSWNCGQEGDENLPDDVLALRKKQARNLMCLLLLANGIPMMCAGDEMLQTQRGNNNPYNQDNEISWLNWNRLKLHGDMFRFVRLLIAFRKSHPSIARSRFWRENVRWFGKESHVGMGEEDRALSFFLNGKPMGDNDLYVMINGSHEAAVFKIQEGQASDWKRVVDTSLMSPHDICEPGTEKPIASLDYRMDGRSIVVLMK